MTPDPFRERDLKALDIDAVVRTDGVRAVVELSVDDLDALVAAGVYSQGLCGICQNALPTVCHSCACDIGRDIDEALA